MSEDQFTKLFKYMTDRFDRIEKELDKKANAEDLQRVQNTLDSIAQREEADDDERLVMSHQLTRVNDWIEKASKKVNIRFGQ